MSEDHNGNDPKKPGHSNGGPPADQQVGYGCPPVAHRFMRGKSGNPRGRPKNVERAWSEGQLNSDILAEAYREAPLRGTGKTKYVPMQLLIYRRIFAEAANGKAWAAKLATEILEDAAAHRTRLYPKFYDDLQYLAREDLSNGEGQSENISGFFEYQKKKSRRI